MPQMRLSPIDPKIYSMPVEKQIRALGDYLMRYRRESEYLLNGNLDEGNVFRAGSIFAENIDCTNARISVAQIDDLEVGSNVTMGANATLSWAQVTNQPFIPSQYSDAQALAAWEASGYRTYIDEYGMYSGTFTGGLFKINPNAPVAQSGIMFGGWYGGSWLEDMALFEYVESTGPELWLTDNGFGTYFYDNLHTVFGNTVGFDSDVFFANDVNINGTIGFWGATPIRQQSAAYLGAMTTVETAEAAYSLNEQDMLNDLKNDINRLFIKVDGLISKFDQYGILAGYY